MESNAVLCGNASGGAGLAHVVLFAGSEHEALLAFYGVALHGDALLAVVLQLVVATAITINLDVPVGGNGVGREVSIPNQLVALVIGIANRTGTGVLSLLEFDIGNGNHRALGSISKVEDNDAIARVTTGEYGVGNRIVADIQHMAVLLGDAIVIKEFDGHIVYRLGRMHIARQLIYLCRIQNDALGVQFDLALPNFRTIVRNSNNECAVVPSSDIGLSRPLPTRHAPRFHGGGSGIEQVLCLHGRSEQDCGEYSEKMLHIIVFLKN